MLYSVKFTSCNYYYEGCKLIAAECLDDLLELFAKYLVKSNFKDMYLTDEQMLKLKDDLEINENNEDDEDLEYVSERYIYQDLSHYGLDNIYIDTNELNIIRICDSEMITNDTTAIVDFNKTFEITSLESLELLPANSRDFCLSYDNDNKNIYHLDYMEDYPKEILFIDK